MAIEMVAAIYPALKAKGGNKRATPPTIPLMIPSTAPIGVMVYEDYASIIYRYYNGYTKRSQSILDTIGQN